MDASAFARQNIDDLESVITTAELSRRPSRSPDHEAENRALVALAQEMAHSPDGILQKLADTALDLCRAHSAGVSMLEEDRKRFRWRAIAGRWASHLGGGTPREFGPCGTVLDRNVTLLFAHPERHFPYLAPVTPWIEEGLLVPFYAKGEAIGTIWVIAHDQSRQFDAEDQRVLESLGKCASAAYQVLSSLQVIQDADRHKSEFLAMLAHELRNPLAPIRNALQILQLTSGDAKEVQSTLQMMDRQVDQIARLVDDLLDINCISRGKIELRRERSALASVVHHAAEAIRPLCESRDHDLTVTLPPQPIYLNADPTRLAQVVSNLLHNACKFTERGGRIRLTVEGKGQQAVIRVQDTGIGIAADQLLRIFEMFTQVDTSLERAQSGLGLGLTLVKNLVEMHDGTVEARSAGIGQGSEFVVRLPIMAETREPLPEPTVNARTTTPARRILVVDDYRDAATSLARLLQLTGNETYTANDGLAAVEAVATFRPDVVLLDIGLPKLNGYEAARKIREQQWGKSIVLVALTGWGQDEDRQKSREAGFNAHMVKPVDRIALMKLLAELGAG